MDGGCQPPPPPIELEGELEYEVEKILDKGICKIRDRKRIGYLIHWRAMTTCMIVGNQSTTYDIVRRVSRHMRMLVDLCLTLVDAEQRGDEIIHTLFCVVYCRPSVSG